MTTIKHADRNPQLGECARQFTLMQKHFNAIGPASAVNEMKRSGFKFLKDDACPFQFAGYVTQETIPGGTIFRQWDVAPEDTEQRDD